MVFTRLQLVDIFTTQLNSNELWYLNNTSLASSAVLLIDFYFISLQLREPISFVQAHQEYSLLVS